MEIYKVKEEDLVGRIKNFPIEVVNKMIERQFDQRGKRDVKVFQEVLGSVFCWADTIEGHEFWSDVLLSKNFALFFKKYPKQGGRRSNR